MTIEEQLEIVAGLVAEGEWTHADRMIRPLARNPHPGHIRRVMELEAEIVDALIAAQGVEL